MSVLVYWYIGIDILVLIYWYWQVIDSPDDHISDDTKYLRALRLRKLSCPATRHACSHFPFHVNCVELSRKTLATNKKPDNRTVYNNIERDNNITSTDSLLSRNKRKRNRMVEYISERNIVIAWDSIKGSRMASNKIEEKRLR